MTENAKELKTTPAQENYIQTIYRMSQSGLVRPSELAQRIGVQRASVSKFILSLVRKGFVLHESHGDIELTEKGTALAQAIIRRDECLRRLLVEVCGMDPENAHTEVHRLEHVISDEVLLRLEMLVDFAASSEAWLKRLRYRTNSAWSERLATEGVKVGETPVHPKQTIEEK